ncbi:MAG: hypothetical protein EWV40_12640 [Microcystis flos-aquae Mf_WU_F_19750830_S460]|uniref:Uncharacterized protein n=1 Tax=Microcystis flos-aquae Mf_WU_F_19750830_S460 TaxID=2486237 RepID=A0A552LLD9_9CHRO|nr:MAG: hypothetical protein EWV40_12640 [Microcystis flos-aquae Mf_WU_F_19750830_S460]
MWGVGCRVWGVERINKNNLLSPEYCLLSPEYCLLSPVSCLLNTPINSFVRIQIHVRNNLANQRQNSNLFTRN